MMLFFKIFTSKSQSLRFLALGLSYAISLLIFQRGLLVKRQVLPHRSSCLDELNSAATKQRNCWLGPRVNQVILLIIDALRYDFIFPGEGRLDERNNYYFKQMSRVSKLYHRHSSNTAFFAFVADAPTTTFQRIKALVTGSVPAFIEASENFGGTEITEDNIVDQLIRRGHNITLLGDETWLQLLPGRFHRHFEEPSFDIKDLDTVDNTVIAHIFDEIKRPDWSLMIAHCLGVDHAGHRYGPAHPEMRRKLQQMDHLILNITERMPNDTILFVFGDHGMTQTGDHGGDTTNELYSALFSYYSNDKKLNLRSSCSSNEDLKLQQVSLVPTLAILLDVPIPYSNIGLLIDSILGPNPIREIRLNSFQMIRYAQEYIKSHSHLRGKLTQIVREHESSPDDFASNQKTILALQELIRNSLDQFQYPLCLIGLYSILETLSFNGVLLLSGIDAWLTMRFWVFRSALLLLQLSLMFAQKPGMDMVLFAMASQALSLCYHLLIFWTKMCQRMRSANAANANNNIGFVSISLCLVLGTQLVLSLLPLSNSYIIYESDVLSFVLKSFICWMILQYFNKHRSLLFKSTLLDIIEELSYPLQVLSFTRVLKFCESCREEKVSCLGLTIDVGPAFLACLAITFCFCSWFLSDQTEHPLAYKVSRAFAWPMTVLLHLHWLFEINANTFTGKQQQQATAANRANIDETSALIELASRSMAQLIYLGFFLHHFVLYWLSSSVSEAEQKYNFWHKSRFQVLGLTLTMLAGYKHGAQMTMMVAIFWMADTIVEKERVWTRAFLLHTIGSYAFYAVGHQQTLSAIPWRAAFVGLPGNFAFQWLPGFLILARLFSGKILASQMAAAEEGEKGLQTMLYLLLFGGLKAFGSSIAALVHHRHLMFYKVFAPKFVYESVDCIFLCAFVFLWVFSRVWQPQST